MSKQFNQQLHDDISLLKSIDREKFPEEYRRVFGNIMKRHNISRSTVYAELGKSTPGEYKKYETKSRLIEISKKEIAMVMVLLSAGKSIRHISKTMSLELGFRYTPYRIYKVKEIFSSGKDLNDNKPIIEPACNNESERLLDEKINVKKYSQDEPVEFKGNISRFFYRLSMIDFIDPKRPIKIKLESDIHESSSRVIKNCFKYIAFSAKSGGKSIPEICRFEMENILINEIEQVKRGNKISPAALKQLESIRRSLISTEPENNEKPNFKGGYDLDDMYRVVSNFAPNITRDEVAKYISNGL